MVLAPKECKKLAHRPPSIHSDFCPYFQRSLLKRKQQELKKLLKEEG